MRVLNAKQKKLLTEWAKNTDLLKVNMAGLPADLYNRLEDINDHETLYQNVDRFIWDLRSAGLYKKDNLFI